MAITDAVVPVAGLGTRLLPATKSQPKEMLPVGAKPVVQHVVEELHACGIRRVLFVTGRRKGAIEDHFDSDAELHRVLRESGREQLRARLDFEDMGVDFLYTRQARPRGLGDAVLRAEGFAAAGGFAVALGDTIIGRHTGARVVARLAEAFEASGAACAVAVQRVAPEDVSRYGIVTPADAAGAPGAPGSAPGVPGSAPGAPGSAPGAPGGAFELAGIVEKPAPGEAPSDLAVAARYVLGPAIFPALRAIEPGADGELQLTDAIAALIAAGERVIAVQCSDQERRYDIGSIESYLATFIEFALTDPALGERLREHARELLA